MNEELKFVRDFERALEANLNWATNIKYQRTEVKFNKKNEVYKNKVEHIRYIDDEGVLLTDFFVEKVPHTGLFISTELDKEYYDYRMHEYHFTAPFDIEYYGDDLPDENIITSTTPMSKVKDIIEDIIIRYNIRKGVKKEDNNVYKTKEIVDSILENAANIMEENGSKDKATAIFVQPYGDKRAESYIKSKQKVLKKVGVNSITIKLSDNTNTKDMEELIEFLNELKVPSLIQLPLPNIDENVVRLLDASIDIDRFSYGCDQYNDEHGEDLLPCTPNGILEIILDYFETELGYNVGYGKDMLSGKVMTIIGRGKLVGDPLADILRRFGATVISINSKTPRDVMMKSLAVSDIIISATGKHGVINQQMFNHMRGSHKLIVDAGVSFIDGKLRGDFKVDPDYIWMYPLLRYTPCIGGVGPMTVACVAYNTAILMNNLPVLDIQDIKNKIKERGYDYE